MVPLPDFCDSLWSHNLVWEPLLQIMEALYETILSRTVLKEKLKDIGYGNTTSTPRDTCRNKFKITESNSALLDFAQTVQIRISILKQDVKIGSTSDQATEICSGEVGGLNLQCS